MLRRRYGLSRVPTLSFVLGCACSLALIAVACTDVMAPLPNGATPWTPPATFALWWKMTESCSGRQGDLSSIKWYIVPNATSIDLNGQKVQGETIGDDRIVLVESKRLDGLLVRHEMLHALLRDIGHSRQFLNACNDIVACEGACEKEAGGRPVPPPDAPVLAPRDVATRIEIVPRQPFASQDSGAVAVIVSITNPLSTPAWIRLTPQAPGDPVSHTFGMAMDYNDPNPEGYGFKGYYFIEGTRFPLGANETRRLVWDDILPAGTFGFRGWFNTDTAPRFVVTVGP